MKGIFCAPKFDDATEYSFKWNERLREKIGTRMDYILLLMADAIRLNVEKALRDNPDAMLVHYDHGDTDRLIGQDEQPVVDLVNVALLEGRISYNLNCLSAQTLGKAAYQNGCKAYIGYTQIVSFTTDAEEDFCDAFNYYLLYWLEGHSFKEALEQTKIEMTRIIDDLVKRGNGLAAMLLRANRDAFHCWAKDVEEPPPETCPVSRLIVKLFGYKGLTVLRKVRDKMLRKPKP